MISPTKTFEVDAIRPVRNGHLASRIAVRLPGGISYPKGQILSEVQVAARNEVQTLTFGTGTGGSFKLLWPDGQITGAIAFDAAAAAIQSAIQTVLGTGSVVVTGTGPFVLTYSGTEYKNRELSLPQIVSAITGGTAPSIAQTTHGSAGAVGCYAAYSTGGANGRGTGRAILEMAVQTDMRGCVRDQHGSTDEITAMAWVTGEFLATDASGNLLLPGLDATNAAQLGAIVSGAAFSTAGAILRMR